MFAAGVFMIILGLGMTGRVPWAARLTPRPPKFLITSLSKLRRKAKSDAEEGISSIATPISFGLLTGLMPCAPLQAAQLAAAARHRRSVTALGGGVAMLAFGLGTAPLMLGFGIASSFIPKDWKHRMTVVLAVVVMVFGLVFINRAAMLVGSPVTFNTIKTAIVGGGAARVGRRVHDGSRRRRRGPARHREHAVRAVDRQHPRRHSPCVSSSTGRKTSRAPTSSCCRSSA